MIREEELNDIQEFIERRLLMAELMGGLTSQDKKFINLWNYAMQLQNNWNELKKWLGTRINTDKDYERNSQIKEKLQVEDYVIKQVMFFMQELEQAKDDKVKGSE